jgi:hypothetical protein
MDGLLDTLKLAHKMSVYVITFAAALQNWYAECGVCNVIAFRTVLVCKKNKNKYY